MRQRDEKLYGILVGIPEGKTSLREPRCIWEDNIRMDTSEIS
jgi:hypothetical protein